MAMNTTSTGSEVLEY